VITSFLTTPLPVPPERPLGVYAHVFLRDGEVEHAFWYDHRTAVEEQLAGTSYGYWHDLPEPVRKKTVEILRQRAGRESWVD
jgi:hypothetical protein